MVQFREIEQERTIQMNETAQIALLLCILIIVYVLSRRFQAWKMKRAYVFVIEDLRRQGAADPSSAVQLPYAKTSLLRFGPRDYRPKAVQYLVMGNILGMTENGAYYLKKKDMEPLPFE